VIVANLKEAVPHVSLGESPAVQNTHLAMCIVFDTPRPTFGRIS